MGFSGFLGGSRLDWPVPGFFRVTSPFGMRAMGGVARMHNGVDIGRNLDPPRAIDGAAIVAPCGCRVTATASGHASMGNMAELDLGGGLSARFMHCSRVFVKKGDVVPRGMRVALVGNTGSSTAPHLHAEFRLDGVFVDPALLFPAILG